LNQNLLVDHLVENLSAAPWWSDRREEPFDLRLSDEVAAQDVPSVYQAPHPRGTPETLVPAAVNRPMPAMTNPRIAPTAK